MTASSKTSCVEKTKHNADNSEKKATHSCVDQHFGYGDPLHQTPALKYVAGFVLEVYSEDFFSFPCTLGDTAPANLRNGSSKSIGKGKTVVEL